ncbi:hypothetical protein NIIDMKKI_35920 [Mycobacterium kansasii]|uniref:Uncharacterized protein n=1 Tax=Mycobacterium kansasii TaxID=1768 RepID=A0A7G1IBE9_MYCKA|nr:hypothetical protein NIIDMKKI_35920 [Mycobacterium kansasii]
MTFTLAETLWLADHGFDNLLLAYPTTDRAALPQLGELTAEDPERAPIVMVDSVEHLDLIESATAQPVRLCLDLDAGYWRAGGRVKIGPKRSPLHTPEQIRALAVEIARRPSLTLVALMSYEGHIAGFGDNVAGKSAQNAAVRWMQRRSFAELRERRARAVELLRDVADIKIVNAGGTGDLQLVAQEPAITEATAGSGFYAPTLFDSYSTFTLRPAAIFALPVCRRPAGDTVTALGGGYLASGVGAKDRMPTPTCRAGSNWTRWKAPVRSRRHCRARRPGDCRSATRCISGTPRPASCVSASIGCIWFGARRSSTPSRPTGVRVALFSNDGMVRLPAVRQGAAMTAITALPTELATMREVIETLAPIERGAGDPGEQEAAAKIVEYLRAAGAQNARIEEEQFYDGYPQLHAKLSAVGVGAAIAGLISRRLRVLAGLAGLGAGLAIADDCSNGVRVVRKKLQSPERHGMSWPKPATPPASGRSWCALITTPHTAASSSNPAISGSSSSDSRGSSSASTPHCRTGGRRSWRRRWPAPARCGAAAR